MKISFNCTDDKQVVHTHRDAGLSDQVPCSQPDISPEAYLNDYRNRMPFHYIEEGSDGYYYWQYGSIMDLVINFVDEIAQSEDMPEAVLDVRIGDKSVVDPVAGIAHLGSMAARSTADYYTLQQIDKIVGNLSQQIKDLQEGGVASIVDAPENLMSGQLLMWDSEARRLVGSPLVKGDAEKSLTLKTSSSDPNFASHEGAVLLGRGLRSSFPYQVIIGHYNQLDPDAIFTIGSGFSRVAPLTAFSVARDGQVLVSSEPVSEKGVVRLKELSSLRSDLTSILNQKLERREEVSEYPQAYVKLPNGAQEMYSISSEPVAGTVSLRDDSGNLQTNSPRNAKDSANKEYVDSIFESDAIFDKNLTVKGNLTVAGTSTVIDSQSLSVKDNFILTNSNQVSLIDLSGIVINKDNVSAYGIVLDPADELLKLGLGKVSEDGVFTFLPGEAQPLATRDYVDKLNIKNGEGVGSIISTNPNDYNGPNTADELPVASGHEAIAFGKGCKATGRRSVAIGNSTIANGNCSISVGQLCASHNSGSLAGGYNSVVNGAYSLAFGNNLYNYTKLYSKAVFGQYNLQDYSGEKTIFEVGNGQNDSSRSNAFEIYPDGRAKVYGAPKEANDIARKVDIQDGSLLNIKNGNGVGSIISASLNDYDRPYTEEELAVASGHEAIAFGKKVKATGKRSVAIGNGNTSSGNCSFVIGQANTGTASGSFTGGNQNTNLGNYTLVFGQENSANVGAHSSLIIGFRNKYTNVNPGQSQLGSALIGHRLESAYSNVTIVGSCNEDIPPQTINGKSVNARFVVGNGYSDGDTEHRSNALEVYDDGSARVGNTISLVGGTNNSDRLEVVRDFATYTSKNRKFACYDYSSFFAKDRYGSGKQLAVITNVWTELQLNAYSNGNKTTDLIVQDYNKNTSKYYVDDDTLRRDISIYYPLKDGQVAIIEAGGILEAQNFVAVQTVKSPWFQFADDPANNKMHATTWTLNALKSISMPNVETVSMPKVTLTAKKLQSTDTPVSANDVVRLAELTSWRNSTIDSAVSSVKDDLLPFFRTGNSSTSVLCYHNPSASSSPKDNTISPHAHYSLCFGESNNISVPGSTPYLGYCVALGKGHNIQREYSTTIGYYLNSYSPYATMVGKFNLANEANVLFQVGNGTGFGSKSNAFTVYDNGRAKLQSAPQDPTDVVRKQELDTKADISYVNNKLAPLLKLIEGLTEEQILALNAFAKTL